MGNHADLLCPLCLCRIWNTNFEEVTETTRQILDVIFVNKNLKITKGQKICQNCSRKIQDAFNFKCICVNTEDFISPFTTASSISKINLNEVYMKRNGFGVTEISGSWKVCRLCLQLVNCSFTSLLKKIEQDIIQEYFPDIIIQNTLDPIACETCVISLHNYGAFISHCLYAQDKIEKDTHNEAHYLNAKKESGGEEEKECLVTFNDLTLYGIKEENMNLKEIDRNESPQMTILLNRIGEQEASRGQDIHSMIPQQHENGDVKGMTSEEDASILFDLDLQVLKRTELHKDGSEGKVFKCQQCDYRSKTRYALKTHVQGHHDPSGKKSYYCDQCGYHTKYLNALKSHMLNHMKPSDIKLYSCEKCDYKTKYRNALKSHKLNHKAPSEIQMRKCKLCSYETKHRTALVLHMLKHKKPSEIEMHKCGWCEFQTKFKSALKPHMLKHK